MTIAPVFSLPSFSRVSTRLCALALAASLVSACHDSDDATPNPVDRGQTDNGGGDGKGDVPVRLDTDGRLALYDSQSKTVKVLDLDHDTLLADFSYGEEMPRLYSSPGSRYVLVFQRESNRVSFIDSGLFSEDHGDHIHDYAQAPTQLSFTLNDVKPTHYTVHGEHAVVFNDASSGLTSSISLLSDEAIANGAPLASLSLTNNMHGVAEFIGERLFVTYRDPSITTTTLPAEVDRYVLSGGNFSFEQRYSEQCPLLHGAGVSAKYLVFGCGDGTLAVDLSQTAQPAIKLGNPASLLSGSRIGTVEGHAAQGELVGTAGNQLFTIAPDASVPYSELTIPGSPKPLAQGLSASGQTYWVLTGDGYLHLFKPDSNWVRAASLNLMPAVQTGAITPSAVISESAERLFVAVPAEQTIVEVDLEKNLIERRIQLGFPVARISWHGLVE